MVNSISLHPVLPAGPASPATSAPTVPGTGGAPDFATQLRQQLEQVSQMQGEADQAVQNLVTGRTDSVTEVLTTARKAEVAFSLLMEIRNKLVDAYVELRQIRV
jgi:flagellar hook-basal body complex protein FliE